MRPLIVLTAGIYKITKKMSKKNVSLILIVLFESFSIFGQTIILNSNQAAPLNANAGNDVTLTAGSFIVIGGNPSATNGYGNYLYFWSPSTGLDNPTIANPIANPLLTTTYRLTVTDAKNCSVQDEIIVNVKTSGIDESSVSIDFKVYPNPSDGNLRLEIVGISGPINLKIINSTGIAVHQITQEVNTIFREELDTRLLPKGCYFIIAICNGKVITKPVIIL